MNKVMHVLASSVVSGHVPALLLQACVSGWLVIDLSVALIYSPSLRQHCMLCCAVAQT